MKSLTLIIPILILTLNTVVNAKLPAPELISPVDSSEQTSPIKFDFTKVPGAVRYQLIFSKDTSFLSIIYDFDQITTSFNYRANDMCTDYFWKIRAIDKDKNVGEWSERRVILGWSIKKPILNFPQNESKDISDTSHFSFTLDRSINPRIKTHNGIFQFQFDFYREFNSPFTLPETYINDSTRCFRFDSPDTKYYWRIKFYGCYDSAFSDVYSFNTKSIPVNYRTYLLFPLDADNVPNKHVKFTWSYSEFAKAFKLVLYHQEESDTIDIPLIESNNSEFTYYVDSLSPNSYYYWHVITETDTD